MSKFNKVIVLLIPLLWLASCNKNTDSATNAIVERLEAQYEANHIDSVLAIRESCQIDTLSIEQIDEICKVKDEKSQALIIACCLKPEQAARYVISHPSPSLCRQIVETYRNIGLHDVATQLIYEVSIIEAGMSDEELAKVYIQFNTPAELAENLDTQTDASLIEAIIQAYSDDQSKIEEFKSHLKY